ncbi:MAG: cyclic nucleotide-binding domain-containing protein [Flavihumibacter sp.]|nr:cyclic nucleotide-binding domain-containing protein [Flavihumibacter sp.]
MQNSLSSLREVLNKVHPLTDAEFSKLSSYLFYKPVKPKEWLINENETEEHLYFVNEGMFRKYFRKDKEEVITGFYKEGSFMSSIISFITGNPSLHVIEATENSAVLGIEKRHLDALMAAMPSLETTWRLLLTKMYADKEMNEYKRAKFSKRELFLNFYNEEPELIQRVPQKYLASYLQIAPETYCRLKHYRYDEAKKVAKAS